MNQDGIRYTKGYLLATKNGFWCGFLKWSFNGRVQDFGIFFNGNGCFYKMKQNYSKKFG